MQHARSYLALQGAAMLSQILNLGKDVLVKKRARPSSTNGRSGTISIRFGKKRLSAELTERLTVLSESLVSVCGSAESSFLGLSRDLQGLYANACQLNEQIMQTVKWIEGDTEQSVLTEIGGLARASLSESKRYQKEVRANLRNVNAAVEHLGKLTNKCDTVGRIAMFLKAVGLNISVESSRSTASYEMFSVIADDIRQLSDKITEIAEDMRHDSKTARSSQLSAFAKISEGLDGLSQVVEAEERDVEAAIGEIEQIIELSSATLAEAGVHAREISNQVGEIVVGIQLHDSVNQRIDHITRSFEDVKNLCADWESTHGRVHCETHKFASTYSIMNLQTEQLRRVIEEVRKVHEATLQAFDGIHREVDRLASCLGYLMSDALGPKQEMGEVVSRDPFVELRGTIEHVNEHHGKGSHLVRHIKETAMHASDTAVRLASNMQHVRKISLETHLKALNAIVKAAHLGEEGGTLEVLAQEMRRIADQSSEFVVEVEQIIVSIIDSSDGPETDVMIPRKDTESGSLTSSLLDDSIQDFARAYAQFQQNSANSMKLAEALKDEIAQTRGRLRFFSEVADQFARHLGQMEDIAQLLQPRADQERKQLQKETGELAERYTMETEREVHAQVVGQADLFEKAEDDLGRGQPAAERLLVLVKAEEETGLYGESEKEDDLGDNVELF
jgi:methyl-accepting chemotaxis protein